MKTRLLTSATPMGPLPAAMAKLLAFLVSWVVLLATSSVAAIITFTHSGVGSGSIGGTAFAEAAFSITVTADTENRESFPGGFSINATSTSILIVGLGKFDFTTGTRTFVNHNFDVVGFSRAGQGGLDLFNGPTDPAFHSWDMLSSIGPYTGEGTLLQWTSGVVLTDSGVLTFNDSATSATFQATLVPEPCSTALLLCGALLWFFRRHGALER